MYFIYRHLLPKTKMCNILLLLMLRFCEWFNATMDKISTTEYDREQTRIIQHQTKMACLTFEYEQNKIER